MHAAPMSLALATALSTVILGQNFLLVDLRKKNQICGFQGKTTSSESCA